MDVFKIEPIGFAANSYLLTADGRTAIVVDPAQPRIVDEAAKRGLTVTHALFTHGHFDHIGGAAALKHAGAKIGCPEKEAELALSNNLGVEFTGKAVPPFTLDFTFGAGALRLGGLSIEVISTPGHTAGGVSYLIENRLFTGDTLFFESYGRCDLPTGNERELKNSLQTLFSLKGDYIVYAGHGKDTTLDYERAHNPYAYLGEGK